MPYLTGDGVYVPKWSDEAPFADPQEKPLASVFSAESKLCRACFLLDLDIHFTSVDSLPCTRGLECLSGRIKPDRMTEAFLWVSDLALWDFQEPFPVDCGGSRLAVGAPATSLITMTGGFGLPTSSVGVCLDPLGSVMAMPTVTSGDQLSMPMPSYGVAYAGSRPSGARDSKISNDSDVAIFVAVVSAFYGFAVSDVAPNVNSDASSGSSKADLAEYSGRQVPDPFGVVLLARLLRILRSCVDLGCREICGVKGKQNLGLHVGVKATAGEQLSRRWVKSSDVITMAIPLFRSSGRLINGSEHGSLDPFGGTNSGQFECTASEMGSSAKAMEFVYHPMIQTIWLGEQKGSVVLDFQPVRADLCSTPLVYELVNSSIAIAADIHFSARASAVPGRPVFVDRPVWYGHGRDGVIQEVGELVSLIWQGVQMNVTVDGALISVVTGGLDLAFGGRFTPTGLLWVFPIPSH